jgi:hypothetical protein
VSFKFPFFFSIASLVVEMNNIFSLIKLANTALPSSLLFYAVLRVNYRLTNDYYFLFFTNKISSPNEFLFIYFNYKCLNPLIYILINF